MELQFKVENEYFNTLKNQGYHLTHNYWHGENHLAFNFYLVTLLAFTLRYIKSRRFVTSPSRRAAKKQATNAVYGKSFEHSSIHLSS
jgi:hypothetical protein